MKTHQALFFVAALVLTPSRPGVNGQGYLNLQPQSSYQPVVTQDRMNIFDVEMLRYAAESTTGNFMISPASIKSVLGMILEGAVGSCAEQLRTNLRLPNNQEQARSILSNIISKLQVKTPELTIESANKIFLSNRFTARPEYETLLRNYYLSTVESVNYAQPTLVVNSINNWVNTATRGKIPKLVEPGNFDADTVLVLANALYFKGNWKLSFNEKLTSVGCFYVQNNCHNTNMMENQASFNYGFISEMNAQAIELPYAGDKYSMLIIMPHDRNGLTESFIKDLSYTSFSNILSEMEHTEVQLSMPKLTIDHSEDLVSTLQKLGIQEIFGKKADLTGIVQSDQSPQVDSIVHRTKLEVNELGSIAAAATGAMVIPLIGTSTARMAINHPFLFFIRDVESGVILFEGRVNRPDSSQTPPSSNSYSQGLNTRFMPAFDTVPQTARPVYPIYTPSNAGQRGQQRTDSFYPQYVSPTSYSGNVPQYNGKNNIGIQSMPTVHNDSPFHSQPAYQNINPLSIMSVQNSQLKSFNKHIPVVDNTQYTQTKQNENNELNLQTNRGRLDSSKNYFNLDKLIHMEVPYQQPQPVDSDGIIFSV